MDPRTRNARASARALLDVALGAADARLLVRRAFEARPDLRAEVSATPGRIIVVGFGKAVVSMSGGVCDALVRQPDTGLVIAPEWVTEPQGAVPIRFGGHPLPTQGGVNAARDLAELLAGATRDDTVIALISGGGSSLGALPRPGISLDDLRMTTEELLRSGVAIREINAVRRKLCVFADGGLARVAAPARVISFVLSDVPDDDPTVIASGPTIGAPKEPILIGSGITAGRAAHRFAARMRPDVCTLESFDGPACEAGAAFGARLRQHAEAGRTAVLVGYGESTVRVLGSGTGGRNQELALAAAIEVQDLDGIALLAAGTDGVDGPTRAAGGLVDGATCARLAARGISAHAAMANNDSHSALLNSGDVLSTGPTGTNVADLIIGISVAK